MSGESKVDENAGESIEDIIGDLQFGGSLASDESGDDDGNNPSTDSGDSTQDGGPAPEQPEGDSVSGDDDAGKPSGDAPEAKPGDEGKTGDEGSQDTGDKGDEPPQEQPETIVIDGEEFPVDDVREWRNGYMRMDVFTKRSQEREAGHREWQAKADAQDKLVGDLLADETIKEMVSAHPDVLPLLLQDPQHSRALIGNPKETKAFWNDLDVLADHPELLKRLGGEATPEVADAALAEQRQTDNVKVVSDALQTVVNHVAKEYPDVDKSRVEDYVLRLGEMPEDEDGKKDRTKVFGAFNRLYGIFFRPSDDGDGTLRISDRLIRDEFERLNSVAQAARGAGDDDAAAEEHNKRVDEQLNDNHPPATSGESGGKVPDGDSLPKYKDANDVVQDLMYGDLSE